ncbi:hypothetical protein HDU93_000864, partial [Gonapodya sp. JEL0774]
MPPPRLPIEILDRIVSCLAADADYSSLISLRLVNGALDDLASFGLFREFRPRSPAHLRGLVKIFESWKEGAEKWGKDLESERGDVSGEADRVEKVDTEIVQRTERWKRAPGGRLARGVAEMQRNLDKEGDPLLFW